LSTPLTALSARAEIDAIRQTTITVKDLAGRDVQVKVPVRRMLLGEGRQLYLVASLDREDPLQRIVAWRNDLIEADPATYKQYLDKFPDLAKLPTFKGNEGSLIDIESAIVKKPDVVLLNLEAKQANEDAQYIEKLESLDIPVLYIDFRHYPLQNTDPTIRLLGKIMGRAERAEDVIAFRKQAIARVEDVLAKTKPDRPKVFIERIGGYTEDCCLSFGAENFGKFVDLAGGHNIGSDFLPSTFGQLSPEQVVVSNPDHVIVTSADWQAYVPGGRWIPVGPNADPDASRKKLEWYTMRDAYAGTTAQTKRNFHAIWHQFYNSPYEFIAVQWIAKWLHRDLFADLDPDKTFSEYHKRFLPIAYQPGYAVSLDPQAQ
jgi:iron complex transport system substrate-binding protein